MRKFVAKGVVVEFLEIDVFFGGVFEGEEESKLFFDDSPQKYFFEGVFWLECWI